MPGSQYFKNFIRTGKVRLRFIHDTAQIFENSTLAFECGRDLRIHRQTPQILAPGDADTFEVAFQGSGKQIPRLGDGNGGAGVGAGNGAEHQGRILHGSGHGSLHGNGGPGHEKRPYGDATGRSPKPRDIAKVAWIAQGASHVTAVGNGQHATGQRHRCPSTAAAASFGKIIGIEGFSKHLVKRLGAGTELRSIGFPDADGACIFKSFYDQPILIWNKVFVNSRAPGGT